MKDYQILKTPDGLILHSHFFIQDRDQYEIFLKPLKIESNGKT